MLVIIAIKVYFTATMQSRHRMFAHGSNILFKRRSETHFNIILQSGKTL